MYVNPAFAHALPAPLVRLERMAHSGCELHRIALAQALATLLKERSQVEESREGILNQMTQPLGEGGWSGDELADLLWGLLKDEPEELIWQYIPREDPDCSTCPMRPGNPLAN